MLLPELNTAVVAASDQWTEAAVEKLLSLVFKWFLAEHPILLRNLPDFIKRFPINISSIESDTFDCISQMTKVLQSSNDLLRHTPVINFY